MYILTPMGINMKRLLDFIDAYREANPDPETGKRLPRHKVGEAAGLSPGVVSQWRLGRQEPKMDSILKMCKLLDVEPSEILGVVPGEESTARVAGHHENIVFVEFSTGEQKQLEKIEKNLAIMKAVRNLDDESLWDEVYIKGDNRWENLPRKEKIRYIREFITHQIETLEKERITIIETRGKDEKPPEQYKGVRPELPTDNR